MRGETTRQDALFSSLSPEARGLHESRVTVGGYRSDGYLLKVLRIKPFTCCSELTFLAFGAVRVPHVPEGSLQVAGEAGGITQG